MTKKDFYEKYGGVKVKFSSYYKYTFTYKATLPDGKRLVCRYGGDSVDIYLLNVEANQEETVISILPDSADIYQNGNKVESFQA